VEIKSDVCDQVRDKGDYIEMGGQLRDILYMCGQLWESVGYVERWVANKGRWLAKYER
jgi:hypothetical protein